ncbi:hypothetical protein SDC9_44755 [bioreactor metagenome]|uniref:Uncharacterized protein n=1 Tax=bioreactor metagenome TaxID=1076179 RepID=A0A644W480_9ZZZZ
MIQDQGPCLDGKGERIFGKEREGNFPIGTSDDLKGPGRRIPVLQNGQIASCSPGIGEQLPRSSIVSASNENASPPKLVHQTAKTRFDCL